VPYYLGLPFWVKFPYYPACVLLSIPHTVITYIKNLFPSAQVQSRVQHNKSILLTMTDENIIHSPFGKGGVKGDFKK